MYLLKQSHILTNWILLLQPYLNYGHTFYTFYVYIYI